MAPKLVFPIVGGFATIAEAMAEAEGAATAVPMADADGAATAVPMAEADGGVKVVIVAVGSATGTLDPAACVPISKSPDTDVPMADALGGVSVVIVAEGRITGNDAAASAWPSVSGTILVPSDMPMAVRLLWEMRPRNSRMCPHRLHRQSSQNHK